MANPVDTDARKILAVVFNWARRTSDVRVETGRYNEKVIVRAHPRANTSSIRTLTPVQEEEFKRLAEDVDKLLQRKPEFTKVQKVKGTPALQITFTL